MEVETSYKWMLKALKEEYGLSSHAEGPFLHEFYNAGAPVFKLMMAQSHKDKENRVLVSFHLDISPVDSVQWYLRLRNMHSIIYMTACYYKDDSQNTFLGQDAEIIRMYKNEQRIITGWTRDVEATKRFINQPIIGKLLPSEINYVDKSKAIEEFEKLSINDKDDNKCH